MYKYNAHHHVSGTPFAFVNGILLQTFPETAEAWMDMLTTVFKQTQNGNYYAWKEVIISIDAWIKTGLSLILIE